MRITSSMVVRSTLRDLNQSLSRLQTTQAQLSSGRQLTKASDDPTTASDAMELRRLVRRGEQYARSALDAQGWLQTADTTLTSALDRLIRAKEIAVRAGNSGSIGAPVAWQAMATEIRAIRDDMIAIGNTSFGSRTLFAGTAAGSAYAADGTWQGNTETITRDVAAHTALQVNVTGPDVFGVASSVGGGAGNLFEVLERMAVAIESGDAAGLATEHTNLDAATARMSSATVEIGARAARLETIQIRAEDEEGRLRALLSEVEDVDLVEVMVKLKTQENAYQAALQGASKIITPTLLDFLR